CHLCDRRTNHDGGGRPHLRGHYRRTRARQEPEPGGKQHCQRSNHKKGAKASLHTFPSLLKLLGPRWVGWADRLPPFGEVPEILCSDGKAVNVKTFAHPDRKLALLPIV